MKTTTGKLEGERLANLGAAKLADRSLSAHVRWVLRQDLEGRRTQDVAAEFKAFIDANPDEQAWLAEWDGTDLAAAPAQRTKA